MGRHERTQRVGGTHSVRSFPNHSLDDPTPAAVLLDRQSSLVRKVCASSLPARSTAIERIRASLDELRAVGLRTGCSATTGPTTGSTSTWTRSRQ